MKNFNKYMGAIAIIAMLFTSCSKEETDVLQDDATATLSFETVLNDLVNNSRQQADLGIPACGDDEPAYVHVVLTGDENVGTMETPLVVNVHPTPIEENGEDVWFTQESADLELTPGDYVLTYFAVYNSDDEMIWIAPKLGGDLADFVDNPLPIDISLGAGVKKYVDVEVLCFDDRMVNEYGYLFFDIIEKEAFEYCFFANYCDDDGRHYPARFSVDIWLEDGTELYSGMVNNVDLNGEDPSASPICFALPDLSSYDDDEKYIHYSLTLLDFEGVYDAPEMMDPIEGSLSRNDIWANLNDDGETVEYFHARFGCDDDDNGGGDECDLTDPAADCDGDGVLNGDDLCPEVDGTVATQGCPDSDGDGVRDGIDECANTPSGVTVDEVGCEINGGTEPEPCDFVETADCPDYYLNDTNGWFEVTIGQPYFLGETFESRVAIVSFPEEGDDFRYIFGVEDGYTLEDYRIMFSPTASFTDDSVCIAASDLGATGTAAVNELVQNFDSGSTFYVSIVANVCD